MMSLQIYNNIEVEESLSLSLGKRRVQPEGRNHNANCRLSLRAGACPERPTQQAGGLFRRSGRPSEYNFLLDIRFQFG
jgi:hypothetical protein